jgi:hypothetical protein
MRTKLIIVTCGLVAIGMWGLTGCGDGKSKAPGGGETAEAHDHDHEHAEEGPHGGHIIELGAEGHHAELTHDETTHKIGVYVLGGDAETAAPIEATSVTINVSVDGRPTQYELPAVPQAGEAGGKSPYFELVSEPLCAVVCGESEKPNTNARLSLNIDGKPYVGMIETEPHEHGHDHDHDHEHEHEHE